MADGISPKWTRQHLARARRAARLPRIPEGAGVLLRECPARLRGEPRALPARRATRRSSALTYFWEEFYERMWELHRRIGGDIPGTFAELQRAGHSRSSRARPRTATCRCCRRDESIHLQLRTAVETHRRHFGGPRGGSGCRSAPTARATSGRRRPAADRGRHRRCGPGIEEMLAAHGLEYFVADSHLVAAGEPVFLYSDYLPLREHARDVTASPAAGERASRSPVRALSGRLPRRHRLGRRLLPRPADDAPGVEPRARLPGRLRLPRVPQEALPGRAPLLAHHRPSNDLGTKQVYDPQMAAEKVRAAGHATSSSWCRRPLDHAQAAAAPLRVLALRLGAVRPLVVRGPALARASRARDGPRNGVRAHDARRGHRGRAAPHDLCRCPRARGARAAITACGSTARPSGPGTACTVPRRSGSGISSAAGDDGHPELQRVLAQATRELLLLQSSDWQFLITTGTARDYAERRVAEHYAEFKRLCEMARSAGGRPAAVDRGGRARSSGSSARTSASPTSTRLGLEAPPRGPGCRVVARASSR